MVKNTLRFDVEELNFIKVIIYKHLYLFDIT